MKNLLIVLVLLSSFFKAQFSVKINAPKDSNVKEAYLYMLNGSKDILVSKVMKQNDSWEFLYKDNYYGMMKVYFPEMNSSIVFISENNNVNVSFTAKNNKVHHINYNDKANEIFYDLQDKLKKKEQILPALYQIQGYYKDNSAFGEALKKEVDNLNTDISYNPEEHKFIKYYYDTYNKFITEYAGKINPTNDEIIQFLNTTNNYLEASSLLKPLLMAFLGAANKENMDSQVDKLMKTVNTETPRGQTILSEFIEIFNLYGMKDLKEKYLNEAKNLKCTINERLTNTIKANQNTVVGAIIPNNKFKNPINTKAKTLHDVKANQKIVIFWSSTCPHCEKEITEMLSKYNLLKSKNIEVVGLSLDSDSKFYSDKVKMLPWINDTELRGWYSSYVDTYNVVATPTFYVVDSKNKIIAVPDNFSQVLEFLNIK